MSQPINGEFRVRIGNIGVMSNHGANRHAHNIVAEIVEYHTNGDTHHIIAFIEGRDSYETPDVRFVGDRPFKVDWYAFREVCQLGIQLAKLTATSAVPSGGG